MVQATRKGVESNDLEISIYWRFTAEAIDATPDAPGVFAFFDEAGKLILMGSAAKSLVTIFRSHWKGLEGAETCGASYMGWEEHNQPLKREAELADRYMKRFGRAPRRRAG